MRKLGVIYDDKTQHFLKDLLDDWKNHFETSIYTFEPVRFPIASGRINKLLHKNSLKKFLDQNEVVFFEWVGENLVLASQLPHQAKIITRLHSWELFHWAKWVNWNAVDQIVLVSKAMESRFNEIFPGNAEKVIVLPAGKSLERFQPQAHPFSGKLGMLGSILPIKRVYDMVLTLSELHKKGLDYTLHIAGKPDGEFNNQRYYASLLSIIDYLELTDKVIFEGWVDPTAWLPGIDIYISNSYWEGQQNALLEAMASGCYCLSHCWRGAEEILPDDCIYTTEASLIDKIVQYSQMTKKEMEKSQQRMRSIVAERFDLKDSIRKYRVMIDEVLESQGVDQ